MQTTKKTKKKNPPDSTFRNIDALKRRVQMLERKMKIVIYTLRDHQLFETESKDK